MSPNSRSLSGTIDEVNDAFFWNCDIAKADRVRLARWLAEREALPGAYADTFALFDAERKRGIRLFTGERVTNAAARHIAAEEACRALCLLKVRDREVQQALGRVTGRLLACLASSEHDTRGMRMGRNPGTYCCGQCSVSLWRHLTAGGLDRTEERLHGGLRRLRDFRDGGGRWRVFPFWYTVSALAEIDLPQTKQEIRYVAPVLERIVKRSAGDSILDRRRQEIARRALAKV